MLKVKRSKLLHHVLLVLMAVSIGPLSFYGWQLIKLNREKLETNEKLSQLIIAKSLSREITQYLNGFREQVLGFASAVELTGLDRPRNLALQKKLEEFATRSKNLLYINIVDDRGKGVQAGSYNGDDAEVQGLLRVAYLKASRSDHYMYISTPMLIDVSGQMQPVIIMSTPLRTGAGSNGATTAILGLHDLLHWVIEYSNNGKTVYVVDFSGRIVAHPNHDTYPSGVDFSKIEIVSEFMDAWKTFKGNVRMPGGTRPFSMLEDGKQKEMLGTYYPIPDASWGVIVQIDQKDAYATVTQMKQETIKWGILMLLLALLVGSVSARSITTPIQQLAESTRSIARGDFSKKIDIRSKTEIGELAETFNKMTDDLEQYILQIKKAAKENHDLFLKNRDLFLGTIRALSAAIDEKDPYTRGHADRVTNYSLILARRLGMNEQYLEVVQISALLHDIGKIGIDDRVLKKPGYLTPEEFELMKQHPEKGANIMKSIEQMKEMIPGLKYHHEQWDGNGYPDQLKGQAIPLIARIISVADTFDAMTTNRPYQKAIDLDFTLQKIQQNAGIKYDPQVVTALISAIASGEITLTSIPAPAAAV